MKCVTNKAMILGAGAGQIPFINICKKMGLETIVVSPKGHYPGFELADKCIYLDTTDKEAILEVATKEKIRFITTDQTDVAVPTVAYVSEKLDLPGIGYDLSLKFTNKYLMRLAAKELGVPVPNFFLAKSWCDVSSKIQSNELEYPIIVKPTNSSGSRGVTKVNAYSELEKAFNYAITFSPTKEAIIEEFIEGKEYLADGFAMNGDYITTDFGVKEYFDIPNTYISKMCAFSSPLLADNDVEEKLINTNNLLVKGLGLPFGITHAEYIYCPKDKQVYLVEIAARGGGVYLSSDITPKASGIDTNTLLLRYLAFGETFDVKSINLDKMVSAWRCFELVPGKIISIEGIDDLKSLPGIQKVCLDNIRIGMDIDKLTDDTKKIGPILAYGFNRNECLSVFNKAQEILKIQTINENGEINGIRW